MAGGRISVAVISHVVTAEIAAMFARLQREAPADHDVRLILSADAPDAAGGGLAEADLVRIRRDELFRLPYPTQVIPAGVRWLCQIND